MKCLLIRERQSLWKKHNKEMKRVTDKQWETERERERERERDANSDKTNNERQKKEWEKNRQLTREGQLIELQLIEMGLRMGGRLGWLQNGLRLG